MFPGPPFHQGMQPNFPMMYPPGKMPMNGPPFLPMHNLPPNQLPPHMREPHGPLPPHLRDPRDPSGGGPGPMSHMRDPRDPTGPLPPHLRDPQGMGQQHQHNMRDPQGMGQQHQGHQGQQHQGHQGQQHNRDSQKREMQGGGQMQMSQGHMGQHHHGGRREGMPGRQGGGPSGGGQTNQHNLQREAVAQMHIKREPPSTQGMPGQMNPGHGRGGGPMHSHHMRDPHHSNPRDPKKKQQ